MPPLYSLRNLTRGFGNREVLRIESLDIESGKIYALLGANGAGKSTLMRILAFLDSPTSGSLVFRGAPVAPGQEARFRPGVIWVPQFPVMLTGSLLYNVEYPMALRKIQGPERKKRAMEVLETVKLAHLAQSPAHRLSGGEAQRASIARALAAGAEIILFDEPTANVDERSQGDFITLVRSLWGTGKFSFLVTTHNANLAATLCHSQIFLKDGRTVRQYVLPGGNVAWPARLAAVDGGVRVFLPPSALAEGSGPSALRGIAEHAAGVILRLELSPGRFIEALLADDASREQARSLTLDSTLDSAPDSTPDSAPETDGA